MIPFAMIIYLLRIIGDLERFPYESAVNGAWDKNASSDCMLSDQHVNAISQLV